mgnify:FL=1
MLDLKFLSLKRFTTSLKLLWRGQSVSGSVDNTVLNSGTGGDTIASDDIAGVKYQRVKVVFGADGSATDASSTNPLPADVINALPAGDNNIGNIDVLTVITGTGATNLGKAEDAVHGSADTGIFTLGVRITNANSSLVSAASDYSPFIVDDQGKLWTRVREMETPAGDSILDDTADAIKTIGQANSGVDIGDVSVNNAGGVSSVNIQDGGNAITVDWAGTAPPIGAGAIATALRVTPANDIAQAHDAAVATSYVAIVGAEARTTSPTAVANADVVRLTADTAGRLITQPFGPRGIIRTGYWQFSTASEVALIGSAGAGVFSDLLHLSISNSSTQTNGIPIVTIRDAIGGATRYAYAVATAGGGVILNFPYPVPQTTAANSWTAHPNLAQATIYVMMMTIDRV